MVWWGLHSPFHVQPNYSVAVMLCCVVVGVVTIGNARSYVELSMGSKKVLKKQVRYECHNGSEPILVYELK